MGGCRIAWLAFPAMAAFAIGIGNTVKGGINSSLAQNSNVETATFSSFLGALIFLLLGDILYHQFVGGKKRNT